MIINGAAPAGPDRTSARPGCQISPRDLKAVAADSNDEAGVGTMTMTGNAQAAHVLAGETFYTNNYKTKLIGTMTVNSLLSFSVAAYSGRRVLAKWQNPNQAAGKPFSGVIIRYSTSGYPGTTGGTQIYKGGPGITRRPEPGRRRTLTCRPLTQPIILAVTLCNNRGGEINGVVRNVTCKTSGELNKTFTASGSYTIPADIQKMDLFAVGGGSAGLHGFSRTIGSGGGGGGYTKQSRIFQLQPVSRSA